MRTVGVDLSAQDTKTWVATVDWSPGRAELIELRGGRTNVHIVDAARNADKVGIDSPFGWPDPFVRMVIAHHGGPLRDRPAYPDAWRKERANRTTDLFVAEQFKVRPLSVSADLIGHVAMRCAVLLAELEEAHIPVDRSGMTGAVAECYPAAGLKQWKLIGRGYKGKANATNLGDLVGALVQATEQWLHLGDHIEEMQRNDDAFDAVIAALIARAVATGRTAVPDRAQRTLAAAEGWIHVPEKGSLETLCADG